MRFILFGASGATGRLLVKKLAAQGSEVIAVLRDPQQKVMLPQAASVAIGSPMDKAFVSQLIRKDDIVVSTLGPSRKTRNPWARLVSPKDLMRQSIGNIAQACAEKQARALVYMSAYGVGDDWFKMPWWMRAVIRLSNIAYAYDDHAGAERLLQGYAFPVILLKPVLLVDGSGFSLPVDVSGKKISPLAKINRSAVAQFIADMRWSDPSTRTIELAGEK